MAAAVVATAIGVHRHPWHAATSPASSASPSPRTLDERCRAKVATDARQHRPGVPQGALTTVIVDPDRPWAAELVHDDAQRLVMCTGIDTLTYPDPASPWPMVAVAVSNDLVAAGLTLPGSRDDMQDTYLMGDPVEKNGGYWTWQRQVSVRAARSLPTLAVLQAGVPQRTMVVPWAASYQPDDPSRMDASTSLARCTKSMSDAGERPVRTTIRSDNGGLLVDGVGTMFLCVAGAIMESADAGTTLTGVGIAADPGVVSLGGAGNTPAGTTSAVVESSLGSMPAQVKEGHWVVARALPLALAGVLPRSATVVLRHGNTVLARVPAPEDDSEGPLMPDGLPGFASGAELSKHCLGGGGQVVATSLAGHVLALRRGHDVLACAVDLHGGEAREVRDDPSVHEGFQLTRLASTFQDLGSSGTVPLLFGAGALPAGVTRVRFTSSAGDIDATVANGTWVYEQLQLSLDGLAPADTAPRLVTLDGPHVHRTIRLA